MNKAQHHKISLSSEETIIFIKKVDEITNYFNRNGYIHFSNSTEFYDYFATNPIIEAIYIVSEYMQIHPFELYNVLKENEGIVLSIK